MASSAEYSPIPDVETGDAGASSLESAKARYPEANDTEAAFLGRLDDAIANAKPEIKLPPVDAASLGIEADSSMGFLNGFKIPSICLVALIVLSFAVAAINNGVLTSFYPYIGAIALRVAAFPPTKGRFVTQTGPAFSTIESTQGRVDTEVGQVSGKALNTLNGAEGKFNDAIAPIKDKLSYATKLETVLKKFDDSIDIPDTTDIERMFDGFEDKIKAAFADMGNMVDIKSLVPGPFASRQTLEQMVLYPYVVLFGVLQMLVTFLSTLVLVISLGKANAWELIAFLIISYLVAILQVAVAYLLSSAPMIASHINGFMTTVSGRVNKSLDTSVGPVYKTIFQDGFGKIRDKMLELIAKMNKLEAPLKKAKDMAGGLTDLIPTGLTDSLPAGIKDKLPENVADAIPEKISDVLPIDNVADEASKLMGKMPKIGGFGF